MDYLRSSKGNNWNVIFSINMHCYRPENIAEEKKNRSIVLLCSSALFISELDACWVGSFKKSRLIFE